MNPRLFAVLAALVVFVGCAKQDDSAAHAASSHAVADFAADVLARSQTTPVLVDFWAPWCGPCRMLTPVLEKAATEADGRWHLATVNVDDHGELAQQYGIQSIPNVKLFHGGKVVAEFVGVKSDESFRTWLASNLPK